MQFCSKCGSKERPNDTFCSKCGTRFSTKGITDPTDLPEQDRRTLNNLKNGRRVRRYLCFDCGYSGRAILVKRNFNWIATVPAFVLSFALSLVWVNATSLLVLLASLVFAMTISFTFRCPRCEGESVRKGMRAFV